MLFSPARAFAKQRPVITRQHLTDSSSIQSTPAKEQKSNTVAAKLSLGFRTLGANMEGRQRVSSLRLRSETVLKALAEGRWRLAHGQEAVAQLLEDLDELRKTKLGSDLREVQESILEHNAMYAKNPEVLGSMLHLVFGLDVMSQWLTSRDEELDERFRHLEKLQEDLVKHRCALEDLQMEVQDIKASTAGSSEVQALRRENARLRRESSLSAEAVAPSEPLAASWTPGAKAELLRCLEALEPRLAALPMAPEFMELQEEACEAYHHLRRVLLEAVALPIPKTEGRW